MLSGWYNEEKEKPLPLPILTDLQGNVRWSKCNNKSITVKPAERTLLN